MLRATINAVLLAAFAGCATPAAGADRFGVVARTPAGRPCAVFSSRLAVGDRVSVVVFEPDGVAVATAATVAGETPACGVALEPGIAYALDAARPDGFAPGSIAYAGDVPADLVFRQCSGTETLHLTAWRGTRRLWHGTYDLGYDVEPDCKAGDW